MTTLPPEGPDVPRLDFACCVGGIGVGSVMLASNFDSTLAGCAIFVLFLAFPVALRCQSLGWSPAWCAALLVPPVNIFLFLACLALPPSFRDTRRPDAVAVVLFLVALLIGTGIGFGLYQNWKAAQPIL